jgi:diamine N-acetyltransferase
LGIELRNVTSENWIECIRLTTNKEGKRFVFEEFVASNAVSLAQANIQPFWVTKAIYQGDTMIGFTMYGYPPHLGFYEICRLMIDYRFQGQGYGKQALQTVIAEMRRSYDCQEIYLSFDPRNELAKRLYMSQGFEDTGRKLDDELLYCLKF